MIDLNPKIALGPETVNTFAGGFDGWRRQATVHGVTYNVSVRRGNSVRMAFAGNKRGWQWIGRVSDAAGHVFFDDLCTKSTGVAGLLERAGVIVRDKLHESRWDNWRRGLADSLRYVEEHAKLVNERPRYCYALEVRIGGPTCECKHCRTRRLTASMAAAVTTEVRT